MFECGRSKVSLVVEYIVRVCDAPVNLAVQYIVQYGRPRVSLVVE